MVLCLLGWLPLTFLGRQFSDTLFYYSAGRLGTIIVILLLLNFILGIFLSLLILSQRKEKPKILKGMFEAVIYMLVFPLGLLLNAASSLAVLSEFMLEGFLRQKGINKGFRWFKKKRFP